MIRRKFIDYDMRDDFSFPVYVDNELTDFEGIKGLSPNSRVAGQFTRKDGETYLELASVPLKKGFEKSKVNYDFENHILSDEDDHDWYASTWDGNILFVLHKYMRTGYTDSFAHNHLHEPTTRWRVFDFKIVSQFMLASGIYEAKLYMDHLHSWVATYRPNLDLTKLKSMEFSNLKFQGVKFSLIIIGESRKTTNVNMVSKVANTCIRLDFDTEQDETFVYRLSVVIRNMLQVILNKRVSISKVILNKNYSYNQTEKVMLPKDERENWFLEQSFFPKEVEQAKENFEISFDKIKDKFQEILEEYLLDEKLQLLVYAYLTIDHFKIPLNTSIITLVSGVESYYNEAKYSNGNLIKDAGEKLKRFISLLDNPEHILRANYDGQIVSVEELLIRLRDSRDYFVHGSKKEKFSSEADLIPDLMMFKVLYREILTRLILLEVPKNNN